jgi:deoxyribonuclease V
MHRNLRGSRQAKTTLRESRVFARLWQPMSPREDRNSPWTPLIAQWKQTQQELRHRVVIAPLEPMPRYIAGADAAFSADKERVFAAAVVYDRQSQRIIEVQHATKRASVPYIPTFLSFREGPALLEAIGKLRHRWGAILFDGQGLAHPRRCGLATHMSVTLDLPGVGVAKSRLIGVYHEPLMQAGATAPLYDKDEQIGLVLRTQERTRPLFVSIGHRVDLPTATELVLACTTRYRLPEPTRQADIEVAKLKRRIRA